MISSFALGRIAIHLKRLAAAQERANELANEALDLAYPRRRGKQPVRKTEISTSNVHEWNAIALAEKELREREEPDWEALAEE